MIVRVWQGWTSLDNSDQYENLLRTEIFPQIFALGIPGLKLIDLLRREGEFETEFMTLFSFDSEAGLQAITGGDAETAHVPAKAKQILSRFEDKARHFQSRCTSTEADG